MPVFKKTYELYKQFHLIRNKSEKQDRYTIYQKTENTILDLMEQILLAGQLPQNEKMSCLRGADIKNNLLRVFIRLMKDIKSIDLKTYVLIEESIDEIGRMLGGWIKSLSR